MKTASHISHYAILAAIVAGVPTVSHAAVKINNASRSQAAAYQHLNEQIATAESARVARNEGKTVNLPAAQPPADLGGGTNITADATGAQVELPLRVANEDLARRIGLGETVRGINFATLEACSRIYPGGEFAWDTPTAGLGAGGAQTCVAVVDMYVENPDGRGGKVLVARANLAAGDTLKCNISSFPEYGYTPDVEKVTFPADNPPTHEDVVNAMNQEQKQNAGIRIVAGALVGGLAGNIVGKGERGSDSLFGTGGDKVKTSAVGALAGAGLMAGNVYGGKVGGDVILSTGVNAAAAAVVGNMAATGNTILRVESCDVGSTGKCVYGNVVAIKDFQLGDDVTDENGNTFKRTAYYNPSEKTSYMCQVNAKDAGTKEPECKTVYLQNIKLENLDKKISEYATQQELTSALDKGTGIKRYAFDRMKRQMVEWNDNQHEQTNKFYQIASADEEENTGATPAMVADVTEGAFGLTQDAWSKWLGSHQKDKIYGRNPDGTSYQLDGYTLDKYAFTPLTKDAESGALIDFNNKARMKSTMTGAGIGGALGGFSAYQGAQNAIEERWLAEMEEYRGSLKRVYCMTGQRFLSMYNDVIEMQPLPDTSAQ